METYEFELTRDQQNLEVEQRSVPLRIEMAFSKLPQDGRQFTKTVLLEPASVRRRFAARLFLPDERKLEPKPVLCRLRDTGDVAAVELDPSQKLVQRLLVRVRRRRSVPNALVVLGQEPIAK